MRRQYIKQRPRKPIDVVNYIYNYSNEKLKDQLENEYYYVDEVSEEPTYWDEACTEEAITRGGFRSVDSLFNIAQGYFPNLTFSNFMQNIVNEKCYFFYGCDDIHANTLAKAVVERTIEHVNFYNGGCEFYDHDFKNRYL